MVKTTNVHASTTHTTHTTLLEGAGLIYAATSSSMLSSQIPMLACFALRAIGYDQKFVVNTNTTYFLLTLYVASLPNV